MTVEMKEVEAPKWMLELFKSIDDLDMSDASGFRIFAKDICLQFGPKTVHGIEDVKKWFVKLDEPFITQHKVAHVYQFGRAYFMQGSAVMRKKGDAPDKSFEAAPLFNLLWFNEDGKIIRYVVDFPPEAAAASDAF
jgi:hypothetical protein